MRGLPADHGQKIGLLGGSFDPAHKGHFHIAKTALHRLALHEIWWLPTVHHHFKPDQAHFVTRFASAKGFAKGKRMRVVDSQKITCSPYTFDLISDLRRRYKKTRFVWLMGADNLVQFHKWRNWQGIAHSLPIAIISRPFKGTNPLTSPFVKRFASQRLAWHKDRALVKVLPPVWIYLNARWDKTSSTQLRTQ